MKKRFKYVVENELKAIKNDVDESYFKRILEKEKKKQDRIIFYPASHVKGKWMYYCTHCKTWHVIDFKLKKNEQMKCSSCKGIYFVKHHNKKIENLRVYVNKIEKNKHKEIIIRTFVYERWIKKNIQYNCIEESSHFLEVNRINVTQNIEIVKDTYKVMGFYGGVHHNPYGQNKWHKTKTQYFSYDAYINVINSRQSIQRIMKDTEYKYAAIDMIKDFKVSYLQYMEEYRNYPQLEMIVKMGCRNFLKSLMDGSYYGTISLGILNRMDKDALNHLKKWDMNYSELKTYMDLRINNFNVIKDAVKIRYTGQTNKKAIRTIKYVAKQNQDYNLYEDYIYFVKNLGMNLSDKRVLFPNDLKKSHDELESQYEVIKDKNMNENIQNYSKELMKFYFDEKKLLIRPAQSIDELVEESQVLNHCVRTYSEKVAKRLTSIFFIRAKKKPMKPLATLELRKDKVVQCRAKNNAIPDARVKKLVNLWCKINHFSSCFDVE